MLEYQNISSKWSKKPKNQSDFHFFGQKCQKPDQNSTKMIKKLTEYKNICPKWSKTPQNLNFSIVFCFNCVDFFTSERKKPGLFT